MGVVSNPGYVVWSIYGGCVGMLFLPLNMENVHFVCIQTDSFFFPVVSGRWGYLHMWGLQSESVALNSSGQDCILGCFSPGSGFSVAELISYFITMFGMQSASLLPCSLHWANSLLGMVGDQKEIGQVIFKFCSGIRKVRVKHLSNPPSPPPSPILSPKESIWCCLVRSCFSAIVILVSPLKRVLGSEGFSRMTLFL